MDTRRSASATVLVALFVAALDQLTKRWAVGRLAEGSCTPETCIDVFWTLRFHLHFNPGASFSTGPGLGRWFGVLAIIMTVVLIRVGARAQGSILPILFGVVAGGALGNLADRVFRAERGVLTGEVVDFIDFQWWPIFNVADAAIIGGVVMLIVGQWFAGVPPDDSGPSDPTVSEPKTAASADECGEKANRVNGS